MEPARCRSAPKGQTVTEPPASATMCAAFQHTVSLRPEAVALREAGGGVRYTWAQVGRS